MAVQTTPSNKTFQWIDGVLLLVVLAMVAFVVIGNRQTGMFNPALVTESTFTWHLVRASGLTAYALLGASTLWGLFLSSRIIRNWSPGPVSLLLHSTVSWLSVLLSILHASLLLADKYYHYTVTDLIVPFVGPYRPGAVGLGVIAAWLTVLITISFAARKLIGQRVWRWLHYTSYLSFALVTVHSLLSGTDASKVGMQIVAGTLSLLVVILFILKQRNTRTAKATS